MLCRIKKYIDYKGVSVSAFEKSIGMSNASFGKSLKIRGSIGGDKLEKILSVYPELSAEWLLTGEGEMLKPTTPITPQPATPIAESQPPATVDRLLTIIECQQRTIECQQRTIEALTNKLE